MTEAKSKHKEFWLAQKHNNQYEAFEKPCDYSGYKGAIEVIEIQAVKELEAKLKVAVEALESCANRKECKSYECCASCGPIYEAEEALKKIRGDE